MTTEDILGNAIELIQAEKPVEAQKLLEPYIEANLQDVTAWLWEAKTWPSLDKKIKVLEMCLKYNPNSRQAKQALAALIIQRTEEDAVDRENGRFQTFFPDSLWYAIRLSVILGTILTALLITPLVMASSSSVGYYAYAAYAFPHFGYLFPIGLYQLIYPEYSYNHFVPIWGWLFYAGIAVVSTLSRNRLFFAAMYAMLIIILTLNVKGCSAM